MSDLTATVASIMPVSQPAMAAARARQAILTKPLGALGLLEDVSVRLAGIFDTDRPDPQGAAVIVAGADHGVATDGVSKYPREVTAAMIAAFVANTPAGSGGAAVNALARAVGVRVVVADLGIAAHVPAHPAITDAKIRRGTRNLRVEAAMTPAEATRAIEVGIDLTERAIADGADLIVPAELGIGNTTSAAALTARLLGLAPDEATGRGTGVDDDGLARKTAVVTEALSRTPVTDPFDVLVELGGYEIAAMVGMFLAAAAHRRGVVVDGYVEGAAALVAVGLAPDVAGYLLPAGICAERGHRAQLDRLGLRPLFDLDLRLGEGTGGVLAVPLLKAAAAALREMRTFAEAGVPDA
ncbi:MAG TPA: nicotinate-nucleotide--dimethylbenzimidazole phosphoribosyltransferase [Propionibacteriaceae bacterium]|nr:nicotinate-nucleotide--dimethylbenzimidazole phosphoribosyltransferase [Propionibacteriaceae bacterium]